MRKAFPLFPVLLIVVGTALLLDRTGVVEDGWNLVLWSALAVIGAHKIVQGFQSEKGQGIFWGTAFFFVGLYNIIADVTTFQLPGGTLLPALLIVFGFGALLLFVRRPQDWHLLVPAIVLAGTGALMVAAEMNYLGIGDVFDQIRIWWPVALVVFGGALILNRRSRDRQDASSGKDAIPETGNEASGI